MVGALLYGLLASGEQQKWAGPSAAEIAGTAIESDWNWETKWNSSYTPHSIVDSNMLTVDVVNYFCSLVIYVFYKKNSFDSYSNYLKFRKEKLWPKFENHSYLLKSSSLI